MAKYFNNKIKSGKLAGSVFAVRFGDVIERAYNPYVANPKTAKQVAARAKLKLLSQLSAAYAPVLAMRRMGAVSPRNLFVKANMPYAEFVEDNATIQLADILLTNSTVGMAGFTATRSAADGLQVSLSDDVKAMWDRVVYVIMAKTSSQEVYVKDAKVVSAAGENGNFPVEFPYLDGAIAVYAYGVRYYSAEAMVKYDQLLVEDGKSFAEVFTTISENENEVKLSETRGVYMEIGVDSATTTGVRSAVVDVRVVDPNSVPAPERGTVTGAGNYPVGSDVTLQATAAQGYRFNQWYFGYNDPRNSSTNPLTFTVDESTLVRAIFVPAE